MMAAALVAASLMGSVQTHAGLFKLDLGDLQKVAQGVTITNWDIMPDWTFTDFPNGLATWKLTDWSTEHNTNVVLTIRDNTNTTAFVAAVGMAGNDPDAQGLDSVFDGIIIPAAVKDDYLFRMEDHGGNEVLFRFANLSPGTYHVTLFEGRTTDADGQYGKLWIDDSTGQKEPADPNTGDFSADPITDPSDPSSPREPTPWGHPQTLVVNVKDGEYLWFAYMETSMGGLSGLIIRSWVDSDGDGMPDDWETQYGLNPHDPSDAAQDPNGNGLNNLMEYTCGLDPKDTTKPTILSAVADAAHNQIKVTFSKPIYLGSCITNDPRDTTLATNLANYAISPALAITGVDVKNQVVTLSTARQTPGSTTYTLTVNNVRDLNNWLVAANTKITFQIAPPPPIPQAPIYQWFTIVGQAGNPGNDDGTNSGALFNYPNDVAVDSAGNLYVGDIISNTIRKLTPVGTNWVTTTIAGSPEFSGSTDGTNSDARFNSPIAVTVDHAGNIYVDDAGNQTIRKITPVGINWVTTTIAGLAQNLGWADGTNSDARFWNPDGVAVDSVGNVYVGDTVNETIRKLTPVRTNWVTTTIAGLAVHSGFADGTNSVARFRDLQFNQMSVAVGPDGTLYEADVENDVIRKITPVGTNWVTTTIAGSPAVAGSDDGVNSAARFYYPTGIAADSAGNVYVSDTLNNTIRKLTPSGTNWVVTTIGGVAGVTGTDDGTNSAALFNGPSILCVDSHGSLFVPDQNNHTIRKGVPLPTFQSIKHTNGQIVLTWSAAPGQTFQLQYKSSLAAGSWTNLGSPVTATAGTVFVTDTPGTDPHRFYRAILQP